MPLQSSGAISLNEIHVEAGGTTNTQASINDADIRALIGKADGALSSFDDFYGASSFSPNFTITEGTLTLSVNSESHGFYSSSNFGSISSTTFNSKTILGIFSLRINVFGTNSFLLNFVLDGEQPDADSTFISIQFTNSSTTVYERTDATRGYNSDLDRTFFSWDLSGHLFDGSGTTAVLLQ